MKRNSVVRSCMLVIVAGRSVQEYRALARQAILELLDVEHAAAWLEIEAKICDEQWPGLGVRIDRHHLSAARISLLRQGKIKEAHAATRGRRTVSIVQPADTDRRDTAIAQAAQRKRLLLSRYLGWAQGTPTRPSIIGPAAERVVHDSLRDAATFQLVQPRGGPVSTLLGRPVKGPLDNAVIYTPSTDDGYLDLPIAVPIEVKNVRDWIYPSSQEPYQLLAKAATLQQERPDARIAPVLVCRRAHYTAYRMAKALGFFIIQTRRQYIGAVDEEKLQEVRSELGFLDLVAHNGPDERVRHLFADVFTEQAAITAERWAVTVGEKELCAGFAAIRDDPIAARRATTLDALRAVADRAGLFDGW